MPAGKLVHQSYGKEVLVATGAPPRLRPWSASGQRQPICLAGASLYIHSRFAAFTNIASSRPKRRPRRKKGEAALSAKIHKRPSIALIIATCPTDGPIVLAVRQDSGVRKVAARRLRI